MYFITLNSNIIVFCRKGRKFFEFRSFQYIFIPTMKDSTMNVPKKLVKYPWSS